MDHIQKIIAHGRQSESRPRTKESGKIQRNNMDAQKMYAELSLHRRDDDQVEVADPILVAALDAFLVDETVSIQIALLEAHPTAAVLIAPLLDQVSVREEDNEIRTADDLIRAFNHLPPSKSLHEVLI